MQAMVVHKSRSAVEAWGPVSPAPAPPSPPGRPRTSQSQPQVVYHFSPAPFAVKQEIKRLTRPKSTPAQLARIEEGLYHHARPQTTSYTGCERLNQLEHEPTRKHNFEGHLPMRKAKSAVKRIDTALVPYHNANGFEFAKSKEKIEVKIKTDDFFNRPEPEVKPVRKSGLDPAIEALIAQLQEQINDLTVYLEEERLNHRGTIKRADEIMREKMSAVIQQHEDEISTLKEDNESVLRQLSQQYEQKLADQEKEMTSQIEKLKSEIEFLHSAFESYKTSLHAETTEKLKSREDELIAQHEEEMETQLMELRSRLMNESNVEKGAVVKENAKRIEKLQQAHALEVDSLTRKYAKNTLELERLTGIQKLYEGLRKEHQQLTKEHKAVTNELSTLATELSDSKINLLEFEASFHVRVQQVDERYKTEVHSLMSENTELRRSYMRKCAELYDSKVNFDRMLTEKDEQLKELAKARDGPVPVKIEEDDDDSEIERRFSYPLTRSERIELQTIRPLGAVGRHRVTSSGVGKTKDDANVQLSQDAIVQPSQDATHVQPSQDAIIVQPSQDATHVQPSQDATVQPSQDAIVQPSQDATVQPSLDEDATVQLSQDAIVQLPLNEDAIVEPPLNQDASVQPPLNQDATVQPSLNQDAPVQPPLNQDGDETAEADDEPFESDYDSDSFGFHFE